MADYIPGPDASFQAWQNQFVTFANANLAALGLVAADMTPVTTNQALWTTAFPAHVAAVNAAKAAKQTKDEARAAYVAVIRPLVRRLLNQHHRVPHGHNGPLTAVQHAHVAQNISIRILFTVRGSYRGNGGLGALFGMNFEHTSSIAAMRAAQNGVRNGFDTL